MKRAHDNDAEDFSSSPPLENADTKPITRLSKRMKEIEETVLPICSSSINNDDMPLSESDDEQEPTVTERIEYYKKSLQHETLEALPITCDYEELKQIEIQEKFLFKGTYNNIIVIDIGSSFSKGSLLEKSGKTITNNTLQFNVGQNTGEFVQTCLYYCTKTGEYSLEGAKHNGVPI